LHNSSEHQDICYPGMIVNISAWLNYVACEDI